MPILVMGIPTTDGRLGSPFRRMRITFICVMGRSMDRHWYFCEPNLGWHGGFDTNHGCVYDDRYRYDQLVVADCANGRLEYSEYHNNGTFQDSHTTDLRTSRLGESRRPSHASFGGRYFMGLLQFRTYS
jgi:hypothetical protein